MYTNCKILTYKYSWKIILSSDDKLNKYVELRTIDDSIILTSGDTINKLIKDNTVNDYTTLNNSETIYFSPYSNYPRFKLNSLNDKLKKTNTYNKSNICVISNNINVNTIKDCLICESPSLKTTYILKYSDINVIMDNYSILKSMKTSNPVKKELLIKFLNIAIAEEVLPLDLIHIYYGDIISDKSKICEFFDNLINNPVDLIVDADLDNYINTSLKKITAEDLEQISALFQSDDLNNVALGVTLLSTFNVIKSACTIGILLANNINNINKTAACKSVAFKQVLNTLSLNYRDISDSYYINNYYYLNGLYKISTDEEDKNIARNIIKTSLLEKMHRNFIDNKRHFNNIDFNVDIKID